uniref:CFA61 protein n=1 Tax=Melopsittacus undulatus TaxID=13146 RepID=A0A8C6J7A5_MELUD
MTTETSSRGDRGVISARRTESHDVSDIIGLFSNTTDDLFGRIDVVHLLERASLALTLCNEKNVAIAHAVFLDYPNWNITDQSDWESFLRENYISSSCTVSKFFSVAPNRVLSFTEPDMENVFEKMATAPDSVVDNDFTLFVCPRHRQYPQLYVRKARLEDHDDIRALWTHQNETLKETCSEYSLADLIESQDEDNQAAVGEAGGTAVGFMSLCSQVNVSLLQECFDLGPFHGLCKPHPEDILKVPQDPSLQEGISMEQERERMKSYSCSCGFPSPTKKQLLLPGDAKDFKGSATLLEAEEKGSFRPLYRGASNAFCIRLFWIDEKYETRSLRTFIVCNFLQDKDFCVILVPHHVPEFPLLQSFVRAVPFCTSRFGQELYVFHRAGLLTSFNVRSATNNDLPGVQVLTETLSLNKRILNDFSTFTLLRRDPDGTAVKAFVAEVLDQIVGVSVIRDEMHIEYIRSHYNIEAFINFNRHQQEEHGHLCHFVLNPIFHHYTKYFLKEILRLAHKSSLYYPIYPQYVKGKFQTPCAHSLTSALHYMAPVRPRRQIVYPLEELGINAPSEQVSKDQLSYSLNHTNRKLVLESKVSVNTRIVVVGASDVGISFLETLVFWPRLQFNNLTLISTHGLPGKDPPGSRHRGFLINSHCFNDEDHAKMSLRSWVNVVVGKMTSINRAAKYVVVSKEEKVPYDYLVLCAGQQYQVPAPTGADIHKLPTNRDVLSEWPQRYTGKVPSNHFTLNDSQDCVFIVHLRDCSPFFLPSGNVIVYGNTMDIYTTVEALLSLGIAGARIHLVQPPLRSNVTCLNNNELEGAVGQALGEAGVSVHRDCVLAQWGTGDDPDLITSASFTTSTKPFQLQCSAFFSFAYRTVDYETFKAINDACLVFDGRLVIDTKFCTNDVSIRAAGPLTKYSRRYYADERTHSHFSSKEIGSELAVSMLRLLDLTPQPSSVAPEGTDSLIPTYKGCKIKGGVLPGGYHYLHIAKPGIPVRLDLELCLSDHGMEIITGKAREGNYFRMHINKYSMVDGITCFSKEPFPASNYICLYGQHERLLNDLCYRWNQGQITDLYRFFREPWSMAIYHDQFIDLKEELRQALLSEQVRQAAGGHVHHQGNLSVLFTSVSALSLSSSPTFLFSYFHGQYNQYHALNGIYSALGLAVLLHRIPAWFGLEGTLKLIQFQPPS